MAYRALPDEQAPGPPHPTLSETGFLRDLADRREFRLLHDWAPGDPHDLRARLELPAYVAPPSRPASGLPVIPGLRLHGAQLFVEAFGGPETPYTRLLLYWQTGTGKTAGVVAIAGGFIRLWRSRDSIHASVPPAPPGASDEGRRWGGQPLVFVIGFTRAGFLDEMLSHPEHGYVSAGEVAEIHRLRVLARGGDENVQRHLSGYLGALRRRITDPTRGGSFRFYGYGEFANRLLSVPATGSARKETFLGLFRAEAVPFHRRVDAAAAAGDIIVDRGLLDEMQGGLVIADEIHNVYNIREANNYGLALQYALDTLEEAAARDPRVAPPRAVFLSATPVGGSATEIVDVLNLLVPTRYMPDGRRLKRSDLFFGPHADGEETDGPKGGAKRPSRPRPGALALIRRLALGRVSFLLDSDTGSYPRRIDEGESLSGPGGLPIPYLKFIRCPMSRLHERTLEAVLDEWAGKDAGGRVGGSLPADAYALYDMVFPAPPPSGPRPEGPADEGEDGRAPPPAGPDEDAEEGPEVGGPEVKGPGLGLYLPNTPARLAAAPSKWLSRMGVTIVTPPSRSQGKAPIVGGGFLSLSRPESGAPGIGAYSGKFRRMIADILGLLRDGKPGKIFVYHHRVRLTGVLLIQELLRANGLIPETAGGAAPGTLCTVCGVPLRDHGRKEDHAYRPARFAVVHNEVDRGTVSQSLDSFDAPDNIDGYGLRVLVGSRIVQEGLDFRAVRYQLIASLPDDIPSLIQVFGRTVRKFSHVGLPPEERVVHTRLYVSTASSAGGREPELARYAEKMQEYLVVQQVTRELQVGAVDAFANYPRIIRALGAAVSDGPSDRSRMLTHRKDGARNGAPASLVALSYEPLVGPADAEGPLSVATYYAYGHGDDELEDVIAAIRALFTVRPVWTYPDLWAAAQTRGAVGGLARDPALIDEGTYALALRRLTAAPPHHVPGRCPTLIRRVGGAVAYYVRVPVGPGGAPVFDVEVYAREASCRRMVGPLAPVRVSVRKFVRDERLGRNFSVRLAHFRRRFGGEGPPPIEDALVEYGARFHLALMRALVEGTLPGPKGRDTPIGDIRDLYLRFRVLVTADDAGRHPEAGVHVGPRRGATPVGYVSATNVALYESAGAGAGWREVPREALGIRPRYEENDTAIGYVEEGRGGRLRFKIRPPLHVIEESGARDLRMIARGAACETRPRAEQERVLDRLGDGVGKSAPGGRRRARRTGPASHLCAEIRGRLLALEEAARRPRRGMADGLRYFYLFNDTPPTPVLRGVVSGGAGE